MGFLAEIVDYIAANTNLIVDTDLFIGGDILDTPDKSVVVQEVAGGTENESGISFQPVQILIKELSYIATNDLAYIIYNLFKHKPGFTAISNIFYCDVLNKPFFINRSSRGGYIFSSNFLFRRI